MDNILDKYDSFLLKNIDKKNAHQIIKFLTNEKCDYIEDILSDYFDIFIIDYEDFKGKYNLINQKFNGLLIEKASSDMNLWELFFC